MYMNSMNSFINLEDSDSVGRTALLIALDEAHNFPRFAQYMFDKIAFLIDRGADITARDHDGRETLHYLFPCHHHHCYRLGDDDYINRQGYVSAMRLLLERGADIHAVDMSGCSVTQAACEAGLGAVWQQALIDVGFDAIGLFSQFYKDFPDAQYTCGRPRAQMWRKDSFRQQYRMNGRVCYHLEEGQRMVSCFHEDSSKVC